VLLAATMVAMGCGDDVSTGSGGSGSGANSGSGASSGSGGSTGSEVKTWCDAVTNPMCEALITHAPLSISDGYGVTLKLSN
jgi:hypothetical protein